MKRIWILFLAALISVTLAGCSKGDNDSAQKKANDTTTAQTSGANGSGQQSGGKSDFSYALGMNIAGSLTEIKSEIDIGQLENGLSDALKGNKTRLTEDKASAILKSKAQQIQAKQVADRKKKAEDNLKKSKSFLAANKKKDGVKVTKDGLQYKVIKQGDGPQPGSDDTVVVDYKGTLPDGTVFDSTYKRGKPATFPVDAVIPGWGEALQMMHVGGKYKLFIPPALAYGEQGAGQRIGPNQALVFDVELKSIKQSKSSNSDGESGNGTNSAQSTTDATAGAGGNSQSAGDSGTNGDNAQDTNGGADATDQNSAAGDNGKTDSNSGQ